MAIKSVSATALGTALALVLALAAAPGVAKKPEPAAADTGPKLNPSKEARPALAAVQTAITAGDMVTAKAKLAEAQAAIHSDDDKYYVGQFQYNIGKSSNDNAGQLAGIELMIQSGKAPADQKPSLYTAAGQIAFQANDFVKADQYLTQAAVLNPSNADLAALIFEAKLREGKTGEALAGLQQAIAAQKAAGQKPPSNWYGRGISEGYKAKLPQTTELTYAWLKDYPTVDNWRDSLTIFRQINQVDADTNIDTMRLMRAVGALKGQGDYVEYADATYLRFPNEAKMVLDEGQKAGQVNINAGNAKEDYDSATKRVAADKASLASGESAALGPKGTGKSALAIADAYASYGDYTKAATVYRAALKKGGVDPAMVNTRLAFALVKGGQKDAARQALAGVTAGPRGVLAKYMTIWIDQTA